MPDRNCLVLRQVELALYSQEAVDASLVGELGGVVLDVHGGRGGATQVLLLLIHNRVSFKIMESSRLPSLRINVGVLNNSIGQLENFINRFRNRVGKN